MERHRNSRFQTNKIGQCHRGALETRESGHEPRMPRHTEAMVDRTRRFPRAAVRGRCAPAAPRRRAANDRLLCRGWGAHADLFLLALSWKRACASRGQGSAWTALAPRAPRIASTVTVSGCRDSVCRVCHVCRAVAVTSQVIMVRIADSLDTFYVLHWASDPRVRFIGIVWRIHQT